MRVIQTEAFRKLANMQGRDYQNRIRPPIKRPAWAPSTPAANPANLGGGGQMTATNPAPGANAVPGMRICPSCGTANEPDTGADICKQCYGQLPAL